MKIKVLFISLLLLTINLLTIKAQELCQFETDNQFHGFKNSNGEVVISPRYHFAFSFENGYAIVKFNGLWGAIDENGTEKIPLIYKDIDNYSEGLFLVLKRGNSETKIMVADDDKYGFVDSENNIVIPFKYDDATSFKNGLAITAINGKYGMTDKSEKLIIPIDYDEIKEFSEGYAAAKLNNKWGYIGYSNEIIIPFIYDNVENFLNGIAKVEINGNPEYINFKGNNIGGNQ